MLSSLASLLHRWPCCFARSDGERDIKRGTKRSSCLSLSGASTLIRCQLLSPFPPRRVCRTDVWRRCLLTFSRAFLQQLVPWDSLASPGSPFCYRQKDGSLLSCRSPPAPMLTTKPLKKDRSSPLFCLFSPKPQPLPNEHHAKPGCPHEHRSDNVHPCSRAWDNAFSRFRWLHTK